MSEDDKTPEQRNRVEEEASGFGRDFVGADEWNRSKIGYLTGVTAVIGAMKSMGSMASQGVSYIGGISSKVFLPDPRYTPEGTHSESEYFKDAMRRYEVSEADLPMLQRSWRNRGYIYLLLTAGAVGYGVFGVSVGSSSLPAPLAVMWPFILVPITFALTIRAAFWNYQIRIRRLVGVSEWIWKPVEWMPR